MGYIKYFLCLLFLISVSMVKAQDVEYSADLVVKLVDGMSVEEFLQDNNLTKDDVKFGRNGYVLIKRSNGEAQLTQSPNIKGAQSVVNDARAHILTTKPNDSYYVSASQQQWNLKKIGMESVWDKTKGSKDVLVAVLDTGLNYKHEDLANLLWINTSEIASNGKDDDGNGYVDDKNGYNFVNNSANIFDDNDHGSAVSSIIGANTNNSKGMAGVNWQVSIMPIKVADAGGSASLFDIAQGIYYAVDNGVKVINLSLGATIDQEDMRESVAYAVSKGVLCVAASGNSQTSSSKINYLFYPAAYPDVLAVGATDKDDEVANLNNSSFISHRGDNLDLVAPGVGILAATSGKSGDDYALFDGTSMAAPQVSGVAALMINLDSNLRGEQIIDYITSTAYKVDGMSGDYDKIYGYGRLDALGAINKVTGTNPVEKKNNGEGCDQDSECKSVWCGCDGGAIKKCLPDNTYNKACISLKEDWTLCETDGQCQSGLCSCSGGEIKQCLPDDSYDEGCPNVKKDDWEMCSSDNDCQSDWCGCDGGSVKKCLPDDTYDKSCTTKLNNWEKCTSHDQCKSALCACDGGDIKKCLPNESYQKPCTEEKKQNWVVCEQDNECVSSRCGCGGGTIKKCLPDESYTKECKNEVSKQENWTKCSTDDICKSGFCGCNGGSIMQCLPNNNYPKVCNQQGSWGDKYEAKWMGQSNYWYMKPGEKRKVWVEFKNTGNAVWNIVGSNAMHLATTRSNDRSSVFYDASTWMSSNRIKAVNTEDVVPGSIMRFEFEIVAPNNTGIYKEYFGLVAENRQWLNDMGVYWELNVTNSEVYSAAWNNQSAYLYLTKGTKGESWFEYVNNGTAKWSQVGNNAMHLGTDRTLDRQSIFYDGDTWLTPNRIELDQTEVLPGETGRFTFDVMPKKTGTFREYFRPVVENVQWLQDWGVYLDYVIS